jgi:hypothetical protein
VGQRDADSVNVEGNTVLGNAEALERLAAQGRDHLSDLSADEERPRRRAAIDGFFKYAQLLR